MAEWFGVITVSQRVMKIGGVHHVISSSLMRRKKNEKSSSYWI
tara:strand:- start:79 stop:207 length:129 start_codon:yes stop_codon:yes gene_type:complete